LVRAAVDGRFMRAGDWGLVECNDPSFVFSTTPYEEPKEIDELFKFKAVCDKIEKEMMETASFRACGKLYATMCDNGYSINDGNPIMWLCNHLAENVEKGVQSEK